MSSFLCPACHTSAITALKGFCAIAATQAQSSKAMKVRVFGIAADLIFADQLYPKDIRNDRNITGSRRNNPERVQNLQKCMKIKDFMKSDVDFRYSGFMHPKALLGRAHVPNGMPQLQIL